MRWFCQLGCADPLEVDPEAIVETLSDHLRVMHPDVPNQPERWHDGSVVVVDTTLEPSDFGPVAE